MAFSPQPATSLYPFSFPGQYVGQWISFVPTSGPFTFTVIPGFSIGTVWIPNLTNSTSIYVGTTNVGVTPFYTTGTTGAEAVPMPAGTTSITIATTGNTGGTMAVYITSLTFDPIKTSPASPAVATVTGTNPISVTGGANPVVSITSPLPIGNGGTGTATPSLIAGTNITISGSWPNQTVSASNTAAVTSVGATSPIASSGGTTPTISLSGIVPVANGGTGTSAPSIVAGSGITVTGTWPNQTIAANATSPALSFNGTTAAQVKVLTGTVTMSALATQTITLPSAFTSLSTYFVVLSVVPSGSSFYNHPIYVTAGSQTASAFGLTNPDSFYTETANWMAIGY